MLGDLITRVLILVLGYAYPAFECFKTMEKNGVQIEELRFWCQYWILVAVLTFLERIGDTYIPWLPMYGEVKLALFIYFWYPKTKGSGYVYETFLRPFVSKREPEMGRNWQELRARAWELAIYYCQNFTERGQSKFFDVLNYLASQSERFNKTKDEMIGENSFLAANPSAYSLIEIWPSLVIGNGGVSNQSGSNQDVSADESTITKQSGSRGGGGGRKQSDASSEDESSKMVSTSSGNDLMIGENSFSAANPSAYSLTEIRPSPVIGNGGVGNQSGGRSGLRISILSGLNQDVSADESAITKQSGSLGSGSGGGGGGGSGRKQSDASSEDESSTVVSTRSGNDLNNSNEKRMKISGSREENGGLKSEVQANSEPGIKPAEQSTKPSEPKDYIHVRARRGQATDIQSLAERARREKISERMKILQDLVPGCNKAVGKALVLDEIINYIQSLQRQVEFLSTKLEAVNSSMNSPLERISSKDWIVKQTSTSLAVIRLSQIFVFPSWVGLWKQSVT